MPDQRKHRGPSAEDRKLFADQEVGRLQKATRDLSWLLSHGYAPTSALKLVGDRYSLVARQRTAISRAACSEDRVVRRRKCCLSISDLQHQELWIDGYNVLTSMEAALSRAVILHARDGCFRDMASMHGTYRKVNETVPAIHLLGELLAEWHLRTCCWWLDQPVSNSGRLKTLLREIGDQRGWPWHVELVPDPDAVLISSEQIVASADSAILDGARAWFNLAKVAISRRVNNAWVVDLSS